MTNPAPILGYTPQPDWAVSAVNQNKQIEEHVLRVIDDLAQQPGVNGRWLAIGRTNLEQAFMAVNRAIMNPQRIKLSGDP